MVATLLPWGSKSDSVTGAPAERAKAIDTLPLAGLGVLCESVTVGCSGPVAVGSAAGSSAMFALGSKPAAEKLPAVITS